MADLTIPESLGEDEFEAIFHLIPNSEDGDLMWTEDEILDAGIPTSRVWTIVESDESDALWCLAGWHSVGRFGYAVSVVSWMDARTEGLYMEPSGEACIGCGDAGITMCGHKDCAFPTCLNCCSEPTK